ncbi:MAG: DUF2851 family protein [Cytophagales bacterium]|jgi:hypothetical protein|nr:DUF2851 family protein [Cytophagales bacterium]
MNELNLQLFIFRNFLNFENLFTTRGEKIKILNIGDLNYDAGPDFINSCITLNDILWFGNIEIHIKSSDWEKHFHSENNLYDNVILHIVFEQDKQIFKKDNTPLPTLEIKKYLHKLPENVPLENRLCDLDKLKEIFPLLILHRMRVKNDFIISLLNNSQGDWETTAFHLLMYNFGLKINNEQMLQVASSVDYKIIQKNKDDEKNLLALLAGQGNLLKFFNSDLNARYDFLKQKYDLKRPEIFWKYSRIHPQNFPEIRIQQVEKLIYKKNSLLEWLKDGDLEEEKFLSKPILNHIKINTMIPLQFSYNQYYCRLSKHILEKFKDTKAEENKITRHWEKLGIKIFNGYESQALLELTNTMCKKNKCLTCPLVK